MNLQQQSNGKLICLKDVLLSDVSTKKLATTINDCIDDAEQLGLKKSNLLEAYNIVIAEYRQNGTKLFVGEDATRDAICRLIFDIPLKNLRRREERLFTTNPAESAADIKPQIQASVPSSVQAPRGQVKSKASIVPTYSVEEYASSDDTAFDSYIGNKSVVSTVKRQLNGAELRGEMLQPLLLSGASGCGKTELARRLSKFRGTPLIRLTASVLKDGQSVIALLEDIQSGVTVLIDEAHVMTPSVAAVFFDLLSNGFKDSSGLPKEFLFVFATNLTGKLPAALKNRCTELKLSDYTEQELQTIAENTASDNCIRLESGVSEYIAKRSHGIARYCVEYVKSLIIERIDNSNTISLLETREFFKRRGIDHLGLKHEHRNYVLQLLALGQASAHSLAASLGENEKSEVEASIEPLLLKHGLISITSKGRYLTEQGLKYAETIKSQEV